MQQWADERGTRLDIAACAKASAHIGAASHPRPDQHVLDFCREQASWLEALETQSAEGLKCGTVAGEAFDVFATDEDLVPWFVASSADEHVLALAGQEVALEWMLLAQAFNTGPIGTPGTPLLETPGASNWAGRFTIALRRGEALWTGWAQWFRPWLESTADHLMRDINADGFPTEHTL